MSVPSVLPLTFGNIQILPANKKRKRSSLYTYKPPKYCRHVKKVILENIGPVEDVIFLVENVIPVL